MFHSVRFPRESPKGRRHPLSELSEKFAVSGLCGKSGREEGLPADLCPALFSDLRVSVGGCADSESDVAFLFSLADGYHVHG